MTITLGNTNLVVGTLAAAFTLTMPAGVTIAPTTSTGTCPAVSVTSTQVSIPSTTQLAAGGCTIVVMVTAPAAGPYTATTGTLQIGTTTYPAASASLAVTASTWYMAQNIAPGTLAPGTSLPIVPSTMTITLANTDATALTLSAPFAVNLPAGMATTSAYLGTCVGATLTPPSQIILPAGTVIPAGGCTIAANVKSTNAGTTINTPGVLQATTIPAPDVYIAGTRYLYSGNNGYSAPPGTSPFITLGTTQSYPLEVRVNGTSVWAENYYLTFEGTPSGFSVGPCEPSDACVGPNPPSNAVPFDTVGAPNFLERQGAGLNPQGGQGATGPPFGGANGVPNIGVSFTPIANKKAALVRYPSGTSAPPFSNDAPCGKSSMPGSPCQ